MLHLHIQFIISMFNSDFSSHEFFPSFLKIDRVRLYLIPRKLHIYHIQSVVKSYLYNGLIIHEYTISVNFLRFTCPCSKRRQRHTSWSPFLTLCWPVMIPPNQSLIEPPLNAKRRHKQSCDGVLLSIHPLC